MKLTPKLVAFAAALAASCAAHATTIDFDTPFGNRLDGDYSEGGYDMSVYAGDLIYSTGFNGTNNTFLRADDNLPGTAGPVVTSDGNGNLAGTHIAYEPAQYGGYPYLVYDDLTFGGGILDVKAHDGSKFTFGSVDYDFFAYARFVMNSGKVTLTAYLDNVEVGTVSFTEARNTDAGRFYNTGYASGLISSHGSAPVPAIFYTNGSMEGVAMDELRITLPAQYRNGFPGEFENIDNLVLNTVTAAVPEPASWAMTLSGLALIGGVARYRRRASMPTTA